MSKNARKNGTQTHAGSALCESVCEPAAPNGANGPDAAAVCKCGATSLNATGERCASGHLLPHNTAALIVGQRSVQFWTAAQDAHRTIVEDALRDAGHSPDDAPRALLVTADGLAQAVPAA